jgi:hypothetical protein
VGRFSYEDSGGTMRFKAWALPLIVAAVCVPIALAFMAGGQGPALGFAVAALTATVLLIAAARSRPFRAMEVAGKKTPGRRVLVLATHDLSDSETAAVARAAGDAADVRILVPVPSRRLDRWLSAEDRARDTAQAWLVHSAATLTAGGLRVSGSVGDSDPVQAVEDELRSFAADEVLVVSESGRDAEIERLRGRLALPLTTVPDGR